MPRSARDEFLDNLSLIDEIVRIVCSRRNLRADEAEEFASTVRLRIIEDDYKVFRRFGGRSTLRTYLVIVIQRMALDFLIEKSSKWRPSTKARRLGDAAVRLEELLVRDGLSLDEACEIVLHGTGLTCDRQELVALASELPVRHRMRLVQVDTEQLARRPDPETPLTTLQASEARERAGEMVRALQQALASLPAEDRLLLKLRFESGLTVPQIAPILGTKPKPLYKRIEWLLQELRQGVRERGILPSEVDSPEQMARMFDLWAEDGPAGENDGSCPSNPTKGNRP